MKTSQQGFAPILIALIVAVVFGGGYVAVKKLKVESPKQVVQKEEAKDEMADWKTYTNEKYGFSIQYPTGTQISGGNADGSGAVSFNTSHGKMVVEAVKNKDSYIKGTNNTPICYNTTVGSDPWQKTLNGINFTVFDYGKYVNGSGTRYCVWQNGIVYILIPQIKSIAGIQTPDVNKDAVLNQILSTFKFTAPATTTSDWKTYTNTEYGFSFKYPPTLFVNKSGYGDSKGWWFITQETKAPVFGFEDSCGTSKDYLNVFAHGDYKDVYVWSKYNSVDAFVWGLDKDFDRNKKISDQTLNGVRIVGFGGSYFLIKGNNVYEVSGHKCAGGFIPIGDIVSTFKFTK